MSILKQYNSLYNTVIPLSHFHLFQPNSSDISEMKNLFSKNMEGPPFVIPNNFERSASTYKGGSLLYLDQVKRRGNPQVKQKLKEIDR